jgi:hypothetical protein
VSSSCTTNSKANSNASREWHFWKGLTGQIVEAVQRPLRLLSIRPPSITPDHWSEIIESTRKAVLVFLSNEGNFKASFRHGPIHVIGKNPRHEGHDVASDYPLPQRGAAVGGTFTRRVLSILAIRTGPLVNLRS